MRRNKDRRQALKGLAALGATAALPSMLTACQGPPSRDAQVIVIGAGLAGLNAAVLLQDQGRDVLILEGSNRIGGRVFTLDDQPHKPDAGGSEFSIVSYARIMDMINRLGVKIIPWRGNTVDFAFHVGEQITTAADWPDAAVNKVQGPARRVPPLFLSEMFLPRPLPLDTADAWLSTAAFQYDVPYGSFMQNAGADQEALRLIETHANNDDLNEISALWKMHTAQFAQSSGSLADLRNLAGGMSRLTDGMADLLQRPVQLNNKIADIKNTADGVELGTTTGKTWRADYVICTAPLPLLREIAISPPLPDKQAAAVQQIPYDDHIEAYFDIVEPFWEEDRLPSSLWTDGPLGLVMHLPTEDSLGYLWLAMAGKASARYRNLPNEQILTATARELARIRPSTVGKVRPMMAHNWSTHPWTQGHLAYRGPGQIKEFGTAVAEPHGRVHFAGEHTAMLASGMEGAMESGERAALEILTLAN